MVSLTVADQMAPDTALRPAFLSVFGVMTEQASKMGMGSNKRIINFYDKYQVHRMIMMAMMLVLVEIVYYVFFFFFSQIHRLFGGKKIEMK